MKIQKKNNFFSNNDTIIDSEEILKDKFLDLCIRIHNLADDGPMLVTRLLFDLVEREKKYNSDYEPGNEDYIETINRIEILLDDMENLFAATKH